MQYQRALHLENALKESGSIDEKDSTSARLVGHLTEKLVEAILFCDEAKIEGDGIQGNKEFEAAFTAQAKVSKSGKHLRKFRLYGRLFKYRCSYMINSEAFLALPEPIQKGVHKRIHEILTSEKSPEGYEHLKSKEKEVILEILMETTRMENSLKE